MLMMYRLEKLLVIEHHHREMLIMYRLENKGDTQSPQRPVLSTKDMNIK